MGRKKPGGPIALEMAPATQHETHAFQPETSLWPNELASIVFNTYHLRNGWPGLNQSPYFRFFNIRGLICRNGDFYGKACTLLPNLAAVRPNLPPALLATRQAISWFPKSAPGRTGVLKAPHGIGHLRFNPFFGKPWVFYRLLPPSKHSRPFYKTIFRA